MKEQEFKLNALELNVLSRIRANGIVTASLEESKRAITAAVRRLTKKGLIVQLPSTDKFGRFD